MNQDTSSERLNIRVLGSGPELVLLHGWGMNSGAFEHWLPYFGNHHKITLIDLPGFGINHGITVDDYNLDNLCELIESVIPVNAVLLGWSLGGLIAQQIASRSRILLRGLITISSSPCFTQTNGWAGIKENVLSMFETQLRNSYAKTLDRFLAIQSMGSVNLKQEVRTLKAAITQYPEPCPIALAAGLQLLAKSDIRDSVSHIEAPTLRIYGKKDSLVPVRAVDCIHEIHPRSDSVVLSDAAHAPFISHPTRTAQIVNQFISTLNYTDELTTQKISQQNIQQQ